MVDGGAAAGVQAEPFHAVMVVARTLVEIRIRTIVAERGCAAQDRVTQCDQHIGAITGRDVHGVVQAPGNRRETELKALRGAEKSFFMGPVVS